MPARRLKGGHLGSEPVCTEKNKPKGVNGTKRESVVEGVPSWVLVDPRPSIQVGWGPRDPLSAALLPSPHACPPPILHGREWVSHWPAVRVPGLASHACRGSLSAGACRPSPRESAIFPVLRRFHGWPLGGDVRILIKGMRADSFFLVRNVKETYLLLPTSLKPNWKFCLEKQFFVPTRAA